MSFLKKSWAQQVDEEYPIIMATKPAVADNTPPLTDTLMQENQQGVNDARPTTSTRARNAYGKTIDKGGQVLGIGFFDAVVKAYSNIVYQPIATALMIVSTIYYIGKLTSNTDATNVYFQCAKNVFMYGSASDSFLAPPLAYLFGGLCNQMFNYGDFVTLIAAMWFPYFAKPSQRNGIFSSIFSIYFSTNQQSYLVLLFFSHCYFLFTQLRSPQHKFALLAVMLVACMLGPQFMQDFVQFDKLKGKYAINPPSSSKPSKPNKPSENKPSEPKPPKAEVDAKTLLSTFTPDDEFRVDNEIHRRRRSHRTHHPSTPIPLIPEAQPSQTPAPPESKLTTTLLGS